LVDKLAYQDSEPQRGDVVVAQHRRQLLVKRIVGLPGEQVEVNRGAVYINQTRLPEAYLVNAGSLTIGPGTLAERKYALLGDNRSMLLVQPVHAVVSEEQILGKVIFDLSLPLPHAP
jgi:signal peptidase I